MNEEKKPLYALSIEEYINLTKKLIAEAVESLKQVPVNEADEQTEFSISELAKFLRCSKVSIHSYKKLGMPFYKIGRKVLFKKKEVLDFMKGLRNRKIIAFKA